MRSSRFETVGHVIEAYGCGEIELEPVSPKLRKEAVHVLPGGAYSLASVARFLRVGEASTGEPDQRGELELPAVDPVHGRKDVHD